MTKRKKVVTLGLQDFVMAKVRELVEEADELESQAQEMRDAAEQIEESLETIKSLLGEE